MLNLAPLELQKIWGYERWIASTHKNAAQTDFTAAVGGDFPLLVKVIQADATLSVQLHPDDKAAALLEGAGSVGKTECWYILDADEGAALVCGLKAAYSRDQLADAVRNNRLEDFLNSVPVKKGDFVFIPAGTVHAIGGGLRILEVQQSSDITYRLYDWGRPRELHVEKALGALKDSLPHIEQPFSGSFTCPYFSLEQKICAEETLLSVPDGAGAAAWQLLFVIEGCGSITSLTEKQTIPLNSEQLIAAAPGEKLKIVGSAQIMVIRC